METENETVLPEQAEGETDDLSKKQQSDEETDDLSKKQQSADESDDLSDEQNSSDAEEPTEEYDWVDELKVSSSHDEIITVAAAGSSATVSMHVKGDDGHFRQILSGSASIGKNGIGKEREGDKKTPRGILGIQFAFGIKDNPGTALDYIKLDGDDYWVDDPASAYYNRLVSSADVTVDWNSAEHMIDAAGSYNYALATDYNSSCVPGDGSAIFMHCRPTGGAGCIAVDESLMKEILKNIHPGCVLIVDSEDEMLKY